MGDEDYIKALRRLKAPNGRQEIDEGLGLLVCEGGCQS